MNLDLTEQTIQSVSIDYAVTFVTDAEAEIRIETGFSIVDPVGTVVVVDPERLGSGAEQVIALLRETVQDAVVEDDGTLVVRMANGVRLEVGADDSYEAWTIAGPRGQKVVVAPGGEISTWDPNT